MIVLVAQSYGAIVTQLFKTKKNNLRKEFAIFSKVLSNQKLQPSFEVPSSCAYAASQMSQSKLLYRVAEILYFKTDETEKSSICRSGEIDGDSSWAMRSGTSR